MIQSMELMLKKIPLIKLPKFALWEAYSHTYQLYYILISQQCN